MRRPAPGMFNTVAMTTNVDTIPVDHHKVRSLPVCHSPTKCLQAPPFLIRTFVRSGSFHPETVFDDGRVPALDEHAVHVWYVRS